VTHFKNNNLLIAGFKVVLPRMLLANGTWKVVLNYQAAGVEYVCDNGRSLIVHDGAQK